MTQANYPEIKDLLELAEENGFQPRVLTSRPLESDDPRTYYALAFSKQQGVI